MELRKYRIAYWGNLKRKEITVLATTRNHARQITRIVLGIHPDSIIQIKEATD